MVDLLKALRNEGLQPGEEPGWRDRGSKKFDPVGVIIHHNAGVGDHHVHGVLVKGRAGLSGPLCNICPRFDGSVLVIAAGRANHAGKGNQSVLDLTRKGMPPPGNASTNGTIIGNRHYYGLECENAGVKLPWPQAQYRSAVAVAAALCRAHGWSSNHVIAHKEWTRRKAGDPLIDMTKFRQDVAARLGHGASGMPTRIKKDLIDRAYAHDLFGGNPPYYYPGNSAAGTPAYEQDYEHFVQTLVDNSIKRFEEV